MEHHIDDRRLGLLEPAQQQLGRLGADLVMLDPDRRQGRRHHVDERHVIVARDRQLDRTVHSHRLQHIVAAKRQEGRWRPPAPWAWSCAPATGQRRGCPPRVHKNPRRRFAMGRRSGPLPPWRRRSPATGLRPSKRSGGPRYARLSRWPREYRCSTASAMPRSSSVTTEGARDLSSRRLTMTTAMLRLMRSVRAGSFSIAVARINPSTCLDSMPSITRRMPGGVVADARDRDLVAFLVQRFLDAEDDRREIPR